MNESKDCVCSQTYREERRGEERRGEERRGEERKGGEERGELSKFDFPFILVEVVTPWSACAGCMFAVQHVAVMSSV